ncbi:MAG: ABC transporter ATP-binding protein [Micropruina sp.]
MISLNGVDKTYRGRNFEVAALRSLSLAVPQGQYLSVVGKSGSGKSSLMKIIGLLDFDYEGVYELSGRSLRGVGDQALSQARRRIGYVFQDFQLVSRFTVRRNLEIASVIRHGSVDAAQVTQGLEDVGLADKALSYPDELSGGQKQRVAIARAMLGGPDLLIADEPTGALDGATASAILDLLADIHQRHDCSILVVTHDDEVAAAAERTVELVAGEVVRDVLR